MQRFFCKSNEEKGIAVHIYISINIVNSTIELLAQKILTVTELVWQPRNAFHAMCDNEHVSNLGSLRLQSMSAYFF